MRIKRTLHQQIYLLIQRPLFMYLFVPYKDQCLYSIGIIQDVQQFITTI